MLDTIKNMRFANVDRYVIRIEQVRLACKRNKIHYVGIGHPHKYSNYQRMLFVKYINHILPESKGHLFINEG